MAHLDIAGALLRNAVLPVSALAAGDPLDPLSPLQEGSHLAASSTGIRSAESRKRLGQLVERSKRPDGVNFPIAFLRSEQSPLELPPLARLVRGGRGGEARLKLLLTLHMLATKQPFDIKRVRSGWWAGALGLPDPDGAGARRVSDALLWLERGGPEGAAAPGSGLIQLDKTRGEASTVTLLDPRGGGGPHRSPKMAGEGRWVSVPLGLWREEWIVVLSTTELAVLLVLIELTGGATDPTFVATGRHEQYGLSPDTWRLATRGLRAHGLIEVGSVLDGEDMDKRRRRNTYVVEKLRLVQPP